MKPMNNGHRIKRLGSLWLCLAVLGTAGFFAEPRHGARGAEQGAPDAKAQPAPAPKSAEKSGAPEGAAGSPSPPSPTPPSAPPAPDAKPAEPKPAEPKPAEPKPAESKPPESKPPESKPAESKPAESKPPESKPPESKPAESKPAEPKQAVVGKASASYTMLARPATADRLKLSDEQRAKIAALLAERREGLSKAAEAERPKIIEENEKKLAAVLTEEQRAEFARIPPEPLLRFKFRFQRWVDVLEEVARQAGLSLVLDAPPPGTLNYADDKEYTPTEAIDLLNSVLLTKGFTLIRRDRMLVCVNIEDGIPENLVPQVTLDELDYRGKFELVRVSFPLEKRPAAAVAEEIKPLMSPLGKVVPLPSTGQLLVTDAAGNMRAIRALIQAMPPVSGTATPAAQPSKSEPPVFAIYPLKGVDPPSVLTVMKTLYPSSSFVLDPKTDQLSVHAGASVQASVKAILEEMMKTGQPPEKQSRLELYPVDPTRAAEILKGLEAIVPNAKLTLDAKTSRLVVWATGADHELLKKSLQTLGMAEIPEQARQFEVYRLTKADPKTTLAMLEAVLPTARLAIDAPTNSIVAIASAADQKAIKSLLEQLQSDKPGPETPELRFYPLTHTPTADMATLIEGLVPKAKVTVDAANKRLAVVAPAGQQEAVKKAVEQFEKGAPPEHVLTAYPLSVADPTSVTSVLKSMFPKLEIVVDPKTNRLLVWASPSEHEALKKAVDQLQAQTPADQAPRFESYPLHGSEPTALTANLQTLVPRAKFTTDAKAGRLVVWATPAEHEAIRAALDKLGRGTSIENTPQVETYRLTRVDPATLVPLLQSLVPDAKVSVDAATKTLIVVAIPADQQTIRGVVRQFQPDKTGSQAAELRLYPITTVDPASVTEALKSAFPALSITHDPKTHRLLVTATPAEHEAVKKTLDQIQAQLPASQLPRFEVYPVHGADPTTLVANLQTLVPNAKLVADAKAGRIVAWGTSADHDALRAALEKMVRGAAPESAPRLEVYRLTKADPTTLVPLLQTLAPDAKISVDAQTKTLIAVAVPADHLTIRTVLEQLQPEKPAPDDPQLRFYPLAQPQPATIVAVLQGLAPKAQITLEPGGKRLTVVATPADHAIVKAAIEQIQTVAILDERSKLVTYPVTPNQKKRFQAVAASLASELPGMQVVSETDPDHLAVWAKPSQHAVISEILEQLKLETPAAEKYQLVAYAIKSADPQNVLTVMKTLFPNAQFVLDARTRRLIVWTLPADQEAIKAALEKIDTGTAAEGQDKLMVYPVPDIDPATAIKVLQEQLPEVKIVAEPKSGAILAWGRPSEHQIIARTLKELKVEPDAEHKETLVVYPLESGDAAALAAVLKTLVPKAQVVVEAKTNSLMATAVMKDHALIRAAIEQMSKQHASGTRPEMAVHSLPTLGPNGAASLIPTLRQIFPDATFAAGADATKLVVWARPADQEPIRKAIEELSKKEPPETAHKLVIYTVDRTGPASGRGMLTILRSVFPDASIGYGADSSRLFVWARPSDHPAIKNMIDEMSKKEPPESAHRLAVFTLEKHGPGGASSVISVLQTMFPQVLFAAGAEPDQLVAWVTPSQETEIREALKTLAAPEGPEKARKMVVYTVETTGSAGLSGAIAALSQMFPEAKFNPGPDPHKLIAWARPADHERIKAVLDELAKKEPPDKARKVVVYKIRAANASASYYTLSLLKSMFPEAQFTIGTENDQLVVWARPAEHAEIKSTINQISSEDPEKSHQMVVYTIQTSGAAGASGAMTVLTTMFPEAKFAAGTEPNKIVAWARPEDQKKIAAAVAELSKKEPPDKARKIVVYRIRSATPGAPYYTMVLLRSMFPDAQFTAGRENDQLVVWARPDEHDAIKSTIEQLSEEDPPETAPKLTVYTLETAGPAGMSGAITILASMFPDAKFTPGSEPDKLAVWARPSDHQRIAAAVKELSAKEPPEKARQLAVYAVEATGPSGASGAISILTTMFPEAKFAAGTEPNKIVAWARPEDQKKIAAAVAELSKKEPPETARKMVVYPFKSANASASYYTLAGLRSMFPDALFSIGADPEKLAVWARPSEHEAIKSAVEQLSQEDPPERAHRMAVYSLESTGPAGVSGAISILTAMFPDAKFSAGAAPDQVVAWARPADQEKIKAAVDELGKKAPPDKARKIVVYPFKSARARSAYYTISMLREMFPDATFSMGAEPDKLVVWARPQDHEAIRSTVEQLSQEDPPERAFRLVAYTMESTGTGGTSGAVAMLTSMFPEAHFTAGTEPGKILAWARPDDQAKIKAAIAELGKKEPPEKAAQAAVYQLKAMTARVAIPFLTTAFPEARFSTGSEPHALIAWARPEDHKEIKATIDKLDAESKLGERTTQVYRFQWAEAQAAMTVLTSLVPGAEIALDGATHSLVVTATPDDHAKIKAAVEEMDRRDEKSQAPRLQVHRVTFADPANLLTVLQGLFRARRDVQLTLDEQNDAIVAMASPAQHETIKTLIEQLEQEAKADSAARLQLYPLKEADGDSVLRVLNDLMTKQGVKAKLSLDRRNNQIVAIARPEQQAAIQKVLDQMEGEERTMEIFTLEVVDPWTAEMAIGRLFGDGYGYLDHGPSVDVDPTSQQLFVRATKEQMAKIRELLVKLGESGIGTLSEGDGRRSRTVSFDGDLSAAIEEIQKIWPQMRQNPIHVMKPANEIPIQGRGSRPAKTEEKRIRPAAGPKPPTAVLPRNEAVAPPDDSGWRPSGARPKDSPPPQEPKAPGGGPGPSADAEGWRASKPKALAGSPDSPVIVIPGDGSVTIRSDDPAALAQFEELLRALTRQRGTVGRNYSVYLLENARASSVAQTLQQVFRRTSAGWRSAGGPVVFVPDDRLNAIVAYAGRADRAAIEALIKVLDTSEPPDSLAADRMHLIPVKNTDAARIEQILRDMFRNQVEALSVEATTNSLVVMASAPLVEEIKRVVNTLDEAAGSDPSRNVSIVPLKKASSERVQKALDVILKSTPSRRRH